MSDDATQQPDPAQISFTISFNARTGDLHVQGPLDQQVLCYGMLERARDLVQAHALKKKAMEHQGIARPSMVIPPEFRRR